MNDLMTMGLDLGKIEVVRTSDMELPAGMSLEEAYAIHRAIERRYVAEEVAKSLNDSGGGLGWAEEASKAIKDGSLSLAELFEAAWAVYWDEGFGRFVSPCLREGFKDVA